MRQPEFFITVSYIGLGMHQEQQPELFSWRKRKTRVEQILKKGSCLRLLMGANVLHQMGGSIKAERMPGQVTQLYIYLPKAEKKIYNLPD